MRKNKAEWRVREWEVPRFIWVVGEGVTDKITLEWSPDGSERMGHLTTQRKTEGAKALRWEPTGVSLEYQGGRGWAGRQMLKMLGSYFIYKFFYFKLWKPQVPFDQAVYEQTVVYFHSQLLCSHQNEWQWYANWWWILAI